MIYFMKDLEHRYGNQTVLRIENFSVAEGCITGLVGPNGSGKSTLLRLLAFVEKPSRGHIYFRGRKVDRLSKAERLKVTLLDQEPYLLRRSVMENVAYGLKARGEGNGCRERVFEALSWVGLPPSEFVGRKWHALSGGEAQRVALAARLVVKPQALLLDEPTTSVDASSAELIKAAVLKAREEWNASLVIASHDWDWLTGVCDETLNLFNGRLVADGIGNLIFGPWLNNGGGWVRYLENQQPLSIPVPPREDSVGIIDPGDISILENPPSDASDRNLLNGILSSLSIQARRGELLAKIVVGGLTFSAKVTDRQVRDSSLYPGRKVWITFPVHALKWL